MAKLKVNVSLLNTRSHPVVDTSDKTNVTGRVKAGFTFESVDQRLLNAVTWYKDWDGNWYWGGGLEIDAVVPVVAFSAGKTTTTPLPPDTLLLTSEPVFSDIWFKKLQIEQIWSQFDEKGEKAKVLILDTGIDSELAKATGTDVISVKNFVPGSQTDKCIDSDFHGNHCASLIASGNATASIGSAPASTLYVGKISNNGSLDGAVTLNEALKEFLKPQYDFDVISISQELLNYNATLKSLIGQHAEKRLIVASVGNDSLWENEVFPTYPSAFPECLSVGSCNNANSLSKFSMSPDQTDIFCYGEKVNGYKNSQNPGQLTGTSQSTAIIAGIAALVISWLKKNQFTYTPASVKKLLTSNSDALNGSTTRRLVNPVKIFNKLHTYNQNENKNLQNHIDADTGNV